MGIFRGDGGTGDSNTDATVTAVTEQATIATTKASEAADSATAAGTSATNAASSASASSVSSAASSTYAGEAASSATSAATSATASAASATAAATAKTNAETAETNAETAETNAAASATTATTKAAEAATSATSASTSASTATTKASEAATSASNAATSETNAGTSASTATTKASEASTSASNAATSEANAAASYDDFDDRYLGAKSSAPTTDNDGDALVTGALYFNTSSNSMKVWSGSAWLDAYASLSGALIATNNLSDLNNAGTARTNLGLGTAATTAATDYATAAQGTKVDGIEAGADVTDTTNVTAAGALMDSEVTNLAQVKAFDSADYATAAQADQTVSLTGGTGISTSGTYPNFTITNDSPDQTVSLTGAGATSISGTYPNFTITSTDTTYSVGDGGLTEINFTSADNTKLDGIATNATNQATQLNEEATITYGSSRLQWADVSGLGGTGANGSSPQNPTSDWYHHIVANHANNAGYYYQLTMPFNQDELFFRRNVGGSLQDFRKVWHDGNDGSGSGLDADLLDGQQGSYYLNTSTKLFKSGAEIGASQNLNTYRVTGYYAQDSNADAVSGSNYPVSTAGILEVITGDQGNNLQTEQRYSQYNTNDKYVRHYYNGNWTAWAKQWTSANDGSGSTLDADTVDGLQASQFLRSDTADSMFGTLTVIGNVDCTNLRADRIYSNNDGSSGYFYNDSGTRTAYTGGDFYIQSDVGYCYLYATNTYLGATSGDTIYTRGNAVSGNNYLFAANGDFYVNARYGSNQLAYGVRAWGRFEMTGTHSFLDNEGFSSVTDISTGRSRLNFTNAMPNTYYSVNVTTGSTSYTSGVCSASVYSLSSTQFYVSVEDLDGGFTDRDQMNVMVVR